MVGLTVADTIAYLMGFYDGENLSSDMIKRLTNSAIANQHVPDPKFPFHSEFIHSLREKIADQWSSILSATMAFG